MTKTLEQMQLDVITRYGHESKEAIHFCGMCERYPNGGWLVNYNYKRLIRG